MFGPLKARVDKICSSLPYVKRGLLVIKEKFPAVLRHALEQATPASVRNAFDGTGLCLVNRAAIDRSQLVASSFPQRLMAVSMFVIVIFLKQT